MNFEQLEKREMMACSGLRIINPNQLSYEGYALVEFWGSAEAGEPQRCGWIEGVTIDWGDGSPLLEDATFSDWAIDVGNQRHHTFRAGDFELTATQNGDVILRHEYTVADRLFDELLYGLAVFVEHSTQSSSEINYDRHDVYTIESPVSVETGLVNQGRFGSMHIVDGYIVYEYTDADVYFDRVRRDNFVGRILDDEGNVDAINLPVNIYTKPQPIIGDLNDDGRVNTFDRNIFFAEYQDVDFDGDIDGDDLAFMREKFKIPMGDVNLDGKFDSTDLVFMFQSNRFETDTFASWRHGDFNNDGFFDSGDLVAAFVDGRYRG